MSVEVTRVLLVFGLGNGKYAAPGFYLSDAGAPVSPAVLQTLANDVFDSLVTGTNIDANLASDMTVDRVEAQNFETLAPPFPPEYPNGRLIPTTIPFVSTAAPVAGTLAGTETSPPQLAIVYTLKSATPGTKGRGRMFLFPPPESKVNFDGGLDATWQGAIDTSITAAQDTASTTGAPAELVVVSRKYEAVYPVVQRFLRETVRSQRRRARRE